MISTARCLRSARVGAGLAGLCLLAGMPTVRAETSLSADPLHGWKLTLPVDNNHDGKADEVADLAGYENLPWFRRTPAGIVFRAPAGGARTSNATAFARSELRQMTSAGKPAAWDCLNSEHGLRLQQRLLHTSVAKPEVAIGQIHDARNDDLLIKYTGPVDADGEHDTGRIEALVNNGARRELLDPAYGLGQPMLLDVQVGNGVLTITYHNQQTDLQRQIVLPLDPAGIVGACYFKAGLYIQACSRTDLAGQPNPVCLRKDWPEKRYDAPDAWAESVISELVVR